MAKKGIYVRMLKSGSTSVTNALLDYPSILIHGTPEHFENDLEFLRLNQGFATSARLLFAESWENAYKFTFVRNPWDRVVSVWKQFSNDKNYLIDKGLPLNLPFNYFVRMVGNYNFEKIDRDIDWIHWHLYPQYKHVVDENGEVLVEFIGRFENLQTDFDHVCAVLDLPQKKLGFANQTVHQHYSRYYNKESENIVREKFRMDIEFFGYNFADRQ